MELQKMILALLKSELKASEWSAQMAGFTWEDSAFIRACVLRLERDDPQGWVDFAERVGDDGRFADAVQSMLGWMGVDEENIEVVRSCLLSNEHGENAPPGVMGAPLRGRFFFGEAVSELRKAGTLRLDDLDELYRLLHTREETRPARTRKAKSRVMYIECKAGGLTGEARIGRVTFSKTGRTLRYKDQEFQSLKGRGFKANYFEVTTRAEYWISGPRRDGQDRLYGEGAPIYIDDDAREEYWITIRNQPDDVHRNVV